MKTKNIILIMLMSCFFSVGCEKNNDNEPKDNYPKEISFTEYSLVGTPCQWVNLNYDNSVIVISSNEELRNYIICTEGSYLEIDFSMWTLLVLNVVCCDAYSLIEKMLLQQLSDNKYLLSIDVRPSITVTDTSVIISILTPKINNDSQIESDVKIIQN